MNNSSVVPNLVISDVYVLWRNVILGAILIGTMVLTIFGNMLVVFAVLREHHMRANLTNRFLVSLAVADLLMGSVVMPFGIIHTLQDGFWSFGRDWCDVWHAFDVLSSTASILNLCAIAVERFWATENPISYASQRTRRRCSIMLVCVWVCSIAISFPGIAWWRTTSDYFESGPNDCHFTNNRTYLICSSLVSFYIPLVVMTLVYIRIYRTATKLIKSLQTGEKVVPYNVDRKSRLRTLKCIAPMTGARGRNLFSSVSQLENPVDKVILRIHRGGRTRPNVTFCVPDNSNQTSNTHFKSHSNVFAPRGFNCNSCQGCSSKEVTQKIEKNNALPGSPTQKNTSYTKSNQRTGTCLSCCLKVNNEVPPPIANTVSLCEVSNLPREELAYTQLFGSGKIGSQPCVARLVMRNTPDAGQSRAKQWVSRLRIFAATTRISKFVREQKAAKTLGLVMGLFIGCWLPFFVCNIIVAFSSNLVNESSTFQNVLIVVTWLGYINSCINPIIYAHSMREFRRAFNRLLCSWWWNVSKQSRYKSSRGMPLGMPRPKPTDELADKLERPNTVNVFSGQQFNQLNCLELATECSMRKESIRIHPHLSTPSGCCTAQSEQGLPVQSHIWCGSSNCDTMSKTKRMTKSGGLYSGPASLNHYPSLSPKCPLLHKNRVLSASYIPHAPNSKKSRHKFPELCAEANF